MSQLKVLREEAVVELQYVVKNKNKAKKIRMVKRLISPEAIPEAMKQIRKGAKRQQQLLTVLQESDQLPVSFFAEAGIPDSCLESRALGWLEFHEVETYRDPFKDRSFPQTAALALNEEQTDAVSKNSVSSKRQEAQTFLLGRHHWQWGRQKSIFKRSLSCWNKKRLPLCWCQRLL